ncbi:PQQ-dependent sugar dehydrogenase [Aureitalea marina]|uniref:Sorbosone dehydrogenase n=1 Tax=Aureitalea marina TaxID=930804 RepID=A0A2S7KNV8_9FLAO|nr:PQQ-dependent sugar dehydrogenase [Aureitalea marina]PQB04253.1 sorbosone dehydrogenase [Aureitalea marina]
MKIFPGLLITVILLISCKNEPETAVVTGDFEASIPFRGDLPDPDDDNGGLVLPDGFAALVVADSVGRARHLAVNDNGDIYIKLRIAEGDRGNMALRDTTGDGRIDIYERFGDYPNDGAFATEMRIHKGYLYFSSELVIYRQKLTPGHLVPEGSPEILVRDVYPIRWHNAKSLAFDNEGGMYVTFSAPTNACEDPRSTNVVRGFYPCPELEVFGGIWRFDEAGLEQTQADGERYATGLRSVVGISWNPQTNSLYAVQHGRDYLNNRLPQAYSDWDNANLPAEEFVQIDQGDDFGWPYTYYDHYKKQRMIAPEYGGDGKKTSDRYKHPIMGLPAHWAPNDLLFYQGDQFPPRYKHGAFIAFHGSTNRGPYPQAGYVVAFIPMENGLPSGPWEIFADGFTGVDVVREMKDAKYRPMGLSEGPDGSLYISESRQGKIWRVIFRGDPELFGDQQLAGMEKCLERSYVKTPDKTKDRLK